MKSLTVIIRAVAAAVALFGIVGCENLTAPSDSRSVVGTRGNQQSANDDEDSDYKTPGSTCPGKSGGVCQMAVSVVVDAAGNATLIVRTGVYIDGVHTPNGTFEKVQWKIFDASGRRVDTKNARASGTVFQTALPSPFGPGYRVAVKAHIRGHTGKKGTAIVRGVAYAPSAPSADLAVTGFERLVVGGSAVPSPTFGEVTLGSTSTFVASVAFPANSIAATATCSVIVTPAVADQLQWVTQQVNLSAGGTGACSFTLSLPLAGSYSIAVTATSPGDPNLANNTLTGTVVVKPLPSTGAPVDVSPDGVQLSVDGQAQATYATIPKGKTGNYTVTFVNSGFQTAEFDCVVTASVAGGAPVSVSLTSVNPITIPAGQAATCKFNYAFPNIATVNFVATAAGVLPLDEDLDNNSIDFQTVAESDHTFPDIGLANVHALQKWLTDPITGIPIVLNEQSTSVSRITLTFAAASSNLGDFKLTGVVTTEGRPISSGTWTVNDLAPGTGGAANCVAGVDPGFVAVNNHTLSLRICAQEVPGDPTTQAIFIEYASAMQGQVNSPSPRTMFGSEISFDVTLQWTLNGSTFAGPGYQDRASALLSFALEETGTGSPTVHQKEKTGQVTVIRNGG